MLAVFLTELTTLARVVNKLTELCRFCLNIRSSGLLKVTHFKGWHLLLLCIFTLEISSFSVRAQDISLSNNVPSNLKSSGGEIDPKILVQIQPIIFQSDDLFKERTDEVAQRLGLSLEGKTKNMASYRSYSPKNCAVFNQVPSMISLYGDPDQVSEMNFIFLNEGDFFGSSLSVNPKLDSKFQAELRKKAHPFTEAMRAQETTFLTNLTTLLSKPMSATLGMGKASERVASWTIGDIAILLSIHDEKFIAIRIWQKSVVDRRGLLKGLSDQELREWCKKNVVTYPNSDVLIGEIPMIDQGPKGYCAPATYERILRYLGITADMYTLAMVGQTERGGGTQLATLNQSINGIVQRCGRQIRNGISFQFDEIKRWINLGMPLIWSIYFSDEIEEISDRQTLQRSQMSIENWQTEFRKFDPPKNLKISSITNSGHVRLIIGYNEKTREIAYSDSWGKTFKVRWITFNAAKTISDGISAITW